MATLISKCNCHIGSTMRQVLEDMLAAVFIKLNKTKQNTLAQENSNKPAFNIEDTNN